MMATLLTATLKDRFAALQAERVRSWPAAQLAANARQRQILVDRFDPAAVAQAGSILPPTDFDDVDGGSLSLDTLTADGPAVLIYFRFANCPACNLALPYYAEQLFPALAAKGVRLVALSPQKADALREIRTRHALPFRVATDRDNGLAHHLGITFEPDDQPSPPPSGWIGDVTGTGSWALPQPAVAIVGPGRELLWLQVSPDWLDRPEADDILQAVKAALS
ncbi:peroxiredoxin-like family protein [Sphingobium sp. YR768]|uniref:peroxiredoxin-like family protein n=1 Tax=Sphingobium sp. YR768 TaxID=1884365 RepID=UPI002108AA9A|nr:peroxiredoxin-like family protein [Sphingobium sp. YR768]